MKKVENKNDVLVNLNSDQIKSDWDFKSLFGYEDYNDPKITKDIKKGVKEIKKFAKTYSDNKKWLEDPESLVVALEEYFSETTAIKPLYYLYLLMQLQTDNTELQAIESKLSEEVRVTSELGMFFMLELSKVEGKVQKKFLKSKDLNDYHYFLEQVFENAKHNLTQSEERIISRYSRPKSDLWQDTLQKSLNKSTVSYRGKEIPHTTAFAMVPLEKNRKMRQILEKKIFEEYEKVSDLAEGALNAILLNRKISNDLRGYKNVYSATVQSYQNTDKEVKELVDVVSQNYKISHDFYKFKKEVLEYDEFTYADRNIEIGSVKAKLGYPESVQTVSKVLQSFDNEAAKAFESMVIGGHYDAFPKKGKRGGAFQASQPGLPNFVFLNHVESFDSLTTLAHETGHALHSYFAHKNQPFQYQSYTISTAEVASTFFENLVFYNQLTKYSEKDQLSLLMGKLGRGINTIQRQIAFFQIEEQLHKGIIEKGHLSSREMKDTLLNTFKDYLGKSVHIPDNTGNLLNSMAQAHFSNPFYVYAYAYGELIAQALYQIYESDNEKGRQAVLGFMSAGSSMSPKDIFKSVGIMVGPKLWEAGLEQMRSDLRLVKRLHRKLNK